MCVQNLNFIALPVPEIIGVPEKIVQSTDFKFGNYIQRLHRNKIPLKIFTEKGVWAYPGTAPFFGYPILPNFGGYPQERKKLRISITASTFGASIRTKVH